MPADPLTEEQRQSRKAAIAEAWGVSGSAGKIAAPGKKAKKAAPQPEPDPEPEAEADGGEGEGGGGE